MTINQILSQYNKLLKFSSSPILDVELLLCKTLNKPKEYIYEYPEKTLSAKQLALFKKLFNRCLAGEPIAYILGHKEFYNLNLIVNKNVLIPRPETEILVEEVLKYCQTKKKILLIDLGCGSGAIGLACAKNLKNAEVFCTDTSASALKIAKQNARQLKAKINFFQGDLLLPCLKKGRLPVQLGNFIIVSNLPYLDTKEAANSALKYEPKSALDGGSDGLKYFRRLFNQISHYNLKPQAIFLEIGFQQAKKVINIAKLTLPHYKFQTIKDLCGKDRVIKITK